MDLSGIIISTNKNYNNDSNITEFKNYYKNNIKHIRSLVYTAQEYSSYNDISLSSIDKNLFVNDPLFRKNTKNKNNIMSNNSFSLFYFINTGDNLLDASFQNHIYDNSNNIRNEITDLWNITTISYENHDISYIYNKYNKLLTDFITEPPWIGLPSSDISWDLINVNLNTGYSINDSIQDICSNLHALRACVLVNNSEDISLIKSSKSDWDQSVYRILPKDVKHFHAPHITEYNEDREIHRNIYWADISGMDMPLGNVNDVSTCIPIWVQLHQLQSTSSSSKGQEQTKEINKYNTGYFKSNRWYLISLLTNYNYTIKYHIEEYMPDISVSNIHKICIPSNNQYNKYISISNFDNIIENMKNHYSNNVVKSRYIIDSIPVWIYTGMLGPEPEIEVTETNIEYLKILSRNLGDNTENELYINVSSIPNKQLYMLSHNLYSDLSHGTINDISFSLLIDFDNKRDVSILSSKNTSDVPILDDLKYEDNTNNQKGIYWFRSEVDISNIGHDISWVHIATFDISNVVTDLSMRYVYGAPSSLYGNSNVDSDISNQSFIQYFDFSNGALKFSN